MSQDAMLDLGERFNMPKKVFYSAIRDNMQLQQFTTRTPVYAKDSKQGSCRSYRCYAVVNHKS